MVRRATKPCAAPIRSATCVVEKITRRRYGRTSSPFLRKRTAQTDCKDHSDATVSVKEAEAFKSDTPDELCDESIDEGFVVH